MALCEHRYLDLDNGLPCVLDEHPATPNGHSYEPAGAPDGHDASEAEAEATR